MFVNGITSSLGPAATNCEECDTTSLDVGIESARTCCGTELTGTEGCTTFDSSDTDCGAFGIT
jgi:hypothetical protein